MYNKDEQVAALEKRLKELEGKFSEQSQAFEKWQRDMRDLLYNLDGDNFSGVYLKQQDGKFAKISVDADGIRAMVGAVVQGLNGEEYKSESQFNMTAEDINSSVKQVIKDIGDDISSVESKASSEITQTANDISMKVATIFGDITTVEEIPEAKDTAKVYCVVDKNGNPESYHYYDGSKWIESDSPVIFSLFKQTATGFELVGDVKISGDLVSGGEIKGSTLRTYDGSDTTTRFVNIGSDFISWCAGKTNDDDGNEIDNWVLKIGLYDSSYAALNIKEGWKLSFSGGGTFDFSGANVTGIYAKFAPDEDVTLTEADTEETTAEAETVSEG